MEINLDAEIKTLQQRFDDIRHYTLDPNGPPFSAQQAQITEWLTAISKDITLYSAIRANVQAASVTVSPPSEADVQQLQAALQTLSRAVQNNQAFNNFIAAVTAVLGAADTVASFANKKQ